MILTFVLSIPIPAKLSIAATFTFVGNCFTASAQNPRRLLFSQL